LYGDSNNLEEQEQKQNVMRHHHFIARKNYDRTIMKNVSSFRTIQQGQNRLEEQIDNISIKNKKVMLVEDEADIAITFKIVLESDANARLKVDSFTEPFAALNNFKSGLYDLVMIDIVLPNMNGFELYYAIKRLDDKVKICFITARKCIMKRLEKKPFLN
jgi:CheY-like chemotaxis protein